MLFTGPPHIGVMISPVLEVQLKISSLVKEPLLAGPHWNKRDTYFIYYANAGELEPFTFTLNFTVCNYW